MLQDSTVQIVNKRILIVILVIFVIVIGYLFLTRQKTAQQSSNITPAPTTADDGKDRAIYEGQTPCADCQSIQVRLNLKDNGKYKMTSVYQGRNVKPLVERGTWKTETGYASNPNATVYILTSSDNKNTYFAESGNQLKQLDAHKKPVTNPYAMTLNRTK